MWLLPVQLLGTFQSDIQIDEAKYIMGRNARLSSDTARQMGLDPPVEIHVKQTLSIRHVPNPCPQPPQLVRHGVVSHGSACPLDSYSDVGVTLIRYHVEITRLTFIEYVHQEWDPGV
ncbi:hypothetical protein Pmani_007281 [Petrolisthes manimaculis]|uniref:Uncharacterized protein n=1 Tax=Petrolisthes manimaculis TaxID=1843537 RepID=A0AAE1UKX6_9EUCA|nr:hypothetical protein Pmani_007281 [Petrolisthes manimaculis]